jgi:hypothetical protein
LPNILEGRTHKWTQGGGGGRERWTSPTLSKDLETFGEKNGKTRKQVIPQKNSSEHQIPLSKEL